MKPHRCKMPAEIGWGDSFRCGCGRAWAYLGAPPPRETRRQLIDDRDELSATVERLYDGIDAALNAMESVRGIVSADAINATHRAIRILRDLRTTEITAEVPE